MKSILTFIFCLIIFANSIAQRNPNTNAGKINKEYKYDSSQNNQTQKQQVEKLSANENRNSLQIGAALDYGNSTNLSASLENGIGFSFKLGFNLLKKNAPISLYTGLGFDYLYFGGKKIVRPNDVDLAINSNAYGWYPYLDLELGHDWPVALFGTVYGGGRFFYTRQNINYLDVNGASKTDTKNIEGDATWIYGVGGGLKIRLANGIKLELRYQKNYGNISTIIDPNTIQFDSFGNLESYQNKTTDTDLDMVFIGLLFCL